jgi:hypothetical protein
MRFHKVLRKLNRRWSRGVRGAGGASPLRLCERLECRLVFSTVTVTNLLDSGPGSLRAAIDAANAAPGADTIDFAGGLQGTVGLASQLDVTQDLTITGTGENKVVLSGNHATRVLSVSGADTHLAIRHLTIADGLASLSTGTALGGGLLNDGANVSLAQVIFKGNDAVGHIAGGGAVANVGGHFEADHADFVGNSVQCDDGRDSWGGAVFNDQGALVDIEHATFSNNTALGGGANGGAIGVVDGSQVSLEHCAFDSNLSQGAPNQYASGGAIQTQPAGFGGSSNPTVNISHCSFTANRASIRTATAGPDALGQGFGGAIMVEFGPTVVVDHSTFDGNMAEGRSGGNGSAGAVGRLGGPAWGGAIDNTSSTLILRHSRFINNQARGGDGGDGGSGANGGSGNFALGGAVVAGTLTGDNTPPTTTIDHCEFVGNRAIGGNGGTGGTGSNGGAAGRADGGGVINLSGTMTVDDSSIVQNTALGGDGGAAGSAAGTKGGEGGLTRGGGLSHERGGFTTLSHTVIAANQALGGAGGAGRAGGDALGGGVFVGRPSGLPPDPNQPAKLTMIDCDVIDNLAAGGTGGVAGNGGNAFGGGVANANPVPVAGTPILTLLRTLVAGNQASGGAAGAGGVTGAGVGGGLYNQVGAIANVDALTDITGNHASTSNDDIFGTLTPI